MKRREFLGALGIAAVAWPRPALGQQDVGVRHVGILMGFSERDPEGRSYIAAVLRTLDERGWKEGRNIRFDYRWAGGDASRARSIARELIQLRPDVIFAQGTPQVPILAQETRTIPIVFVQVIDPVGAGLVPSLSRPGGNITGFAPGEYATTPKLLELLKEVSPALTNAAVIFLPDSGPHRDQVRAIEAASSSLGVTLTAAGVRDAVEIERAISDFAHKPNGGIVVLTSLVANTHRKLIIELAARYHLPAIYQFRYFAAEGGLISYGGDIVDQYRRALLTSTASSGAKRQVICRCSSRRNMSW
jgi:putative ABC transport system substrate-binding protein